MISRFRLSAVLILLFLICSLVTADTQNNPAGLVVIAMDRELRLEWDSSAEVDQGDYHFEGYTVLQGPTPAGPWTRIANYDLVNGVDTIYDMVFDPDSGAFVEKAVRFGSDNGLQYDFQTTEDFLFNDRLYNDNEYCYRLEAYLYNPTGDPKTLSTMSVAAGTPTGTPEPPVNLSQWSSANGGNDHWYAVYPIKSRWSEAADAVSVILHDGYYGYLATITSAEENAFVTDSVLVGLSSPSERDRFWLGGKDIAGSITWASGEPFVYDNWHTGYPTVGHDTAGVLVYGPNNTSVDRPPGTWVNEWFEYQWAVIEWGDYDPSDVPDPGAAELPSGFRLSQNYPNPFNPTTTIEFSLPQRSHVSIVVFNTTGQQVRSLLNDQKAAGDHTIFWDGRNDAGTTVAAGTYLYRLTTEDRTEARKMILLK